MNYLIANPVKIHHFDQKIDSLEKEINKLLRCNSNESKTFHERKEILDNQYRKNIDLSQKLFFEKSNKRRLENNTRIIRSKLKIKDLTFTMTNRSLNFISPNFFDKSIKSFKERCDIYSNYQTAYLLKAQGFKYYRSHANLVFSPKFCSYDTKTRLNFLHNIKNEVIHLTCYQVIN